MGFDDNKVLKEQLGILTYIQVSRIISLDFNSELTLMKAYVEKLNVLHSDGSESDDFEGGVTTSEGPDFERSVSSSKGPDYDHGIPASGDSLDSRDITFKSSTFGLYSFSIADLSCQHQTYGKKSQLESLSARLKES